MKRDHIVFYLNGVRREIGGRHVFLMLAEWLRKEAGMTGTKIVCAEGDCGACTVLKAFPAPGTRAAGSDTNSGQSRDGHRADLKYEAMNSCITMLGQLHGAHLVTVEGIQEGAELSPVQTAMKNCHGSQCGYCTPGFVMALSGMFERHECVDAKTAANYLTGNLCRCTGYQPIIDAAVAARADRRFSIAGRYLRPEAVEDLICEQQRSVTIKGEGDGGQVFAAREFFAPVTLREALTFIATRPDCRIVGAATDIGVQTNKGRPLASALLSLHLIPELYRVETKARKIKVGARVTLADLRRAVENSCPEFADFLNIFASPQIKNVATLVGNLANASPIGDTLPFLLISDAEVHLASRPGGKGRTMKRVVPIGEFFQGYKKLSMAPGEIITHVSFTAPAKQEFFKLYKVSQRKDLDISAVSGAFSVRTSGGKITAAKVAYGGVAATPVRLPEIEQDLIGKSFNLDSFENAAGRIAGMLEPLSDVRGTAAYRRVLAANLFRRFGGEVLNGE